jgi:hypothetical protein
VGLREAPEESRRDWPLQRELHVLAGGRLCGPAEQRRCRTESGAFADWACAACAERVRPEAISPWTWHLVFLHQLSRAGYPFKANDLSLETWLLMGTVRRVLEGSRGG